MAQQPPRFHAAAAGEAPPQRLDVHAADGVRLAVWRWGDPQLPVLLFVHGYPDDHAVWLPLIERLAGRFHLVAYDVRGAGESDKPRRTRDYRLDILRRDLQAVLDAVSPGRPAHLIAHDWGSIQTWEGVTDPALRERIASYTSISGPCLDHIGVWMREGLRGRRAGGVGQVVRQFMHSWYIGYFHLPLLPELNWRLGGSRLWAWYLRRVEGIRAPRIRPGQASDGRFGVKLYRANFIGALLHPRERRTEVPVQLVVATRDHYVRPQVFEQLAQWAPRLWRRDVDAGHWQLLAEPAQLAVWVEKFVRRIEAGQARSQAAGAEPQPSAGGGRIANAVT